MRLQTLSETRPRLLWLACAATLSLQCTHAQPAPVTAPDTAKSFLVTVSGTVSGAKDGEALLSRKALRSGERLRLSLRSSEAAHGLIAYCDSMNQLQMYPTGGTIDLRAHDAVPVPSGSNSFVLDKHEGCETIYVVTSRKPIERLDPRLASALRAQPSGVPCPPELEEPTPENPAGEAGLETPPGPPTRAGEIEAPPAGPRPDVRKGPASGPPRPHALAPRHTPRGMNVESDIHEAALLSDEHGIAVLALRFAHVGASAPFDQDAAEKSGCFTPQPD